MIRLALLATLLGLVRTAVISSKDKVQDSDDYLAKSWTDDDEFNYVEPPSASFPKVFDDTNTKQRTGYSLKSIIKALYEMNLLKNKNNDKNEDDENLEEKHPYSDEVVPIPSQELQPPKESSETYPYQLSGGYEEENKVINDGESTTELTPTETTKQEEQTTQKISTLLEDIVDSLVIKNTAQLESDTPYKYTHNFRYGFGHNLGMRK